MIVYTDTAAAVLRGSQPMRHAGRRPRGFTLVELLMVILLIGILSSFVMVALANVTQSAKEDRTRAQLAKIHELLMRQWNSYEQRRLPNVGRVLIRKRRNGAPVEYAMVARDRLRATRGMLRVELPCYKDEVVGADGGFAQTALRDPVSGQLLQPASALSRAYRARATDSWDENLEGAECLYLILSQMRESDTSALEFFSESEIGDTDGDGMNEILDAWGKPLLWLRWAPGFLSPLQVPLEENLEQEDVFDPMRVGDGYQTNGTPLPTNRPRALYPLVLSAGPDGKYGIYVGGDRRWLDVGCNPYEPGMVRIGAPLDEQDGGDGESHLDNITNHSLTTR